MVGLQVYSDFLAHAVCIDIMPLCNLSGSLSLLDPSGPLQACNGIALPFNHILTSPYISHWIID
jgi:hypothetical protein